MARASDGPLGSAVNTGSLIVIGEPGAGKTGALVALAQTRRAAGDTVVFLSVDRFPGVAIAADLQSELGLAHPLTEVLAAAPGAGRKLLIIDALDAARGGPAEDVFAQLIEVLGASAPDWTVIASIRTFDLRNGRRFRDAMPGTPPEPAYAETGLAKVRHFRVPRLADEDLDAVGIADSYLGALFAAAPDKLRDLLRNVFNLSLAAQLLADGASPDSIRTVATQSDLIDAYEDRRLIGTPARQAASATVAAMVARRRLAVRKVVIGHDQVDAVIQTGVLAESGDLVSFAHHVLFDHVAGRFFLEWDDPARLIPQLGGDSSIALMLAPSLRFAIERLWRQDADGKAQVWRLVADIYADPAVDPVLANVALRTAIERVGKSADIAGLVALIAVRPSNDALATMLSRLARFVGLAVEAAGSIVPDEALAWAMVADAAIAAGSRDLSDATRFLLLTLFDKGDLAAPALLGVFNRAARALLALAWAADPPMQQTATNAIRFVGKSFSADPAASRALLDRMLREPHFSALADKEATWLSEQIMPIARADADFVIEIYRTLYSRDITDNSTSLMGGGRIMPFTSSRSQDYRHCRYELGRQVTGLLELSVRLGTRAIVEASLGDTDRVMGLGDSRKQVVVSSRAPFDLLGRDREYKAWDDTEERHGTQDDGVLAQLVTHLRSCSLGDFSETVEAAATVYVGPAVWTRILGVGAERVGEVADILWPFACNITVLTHGDIVRDAVRFLTASYPLRSIAERTAFEAEALQPNLFAEDAQQRWWRRVLSRFLSSLAEDAIVTDSMRDLRVELVTAGELTGNPPTRSMMINWESSDGVTRSLLAGEGVDTEEGVDAQMLSQSEALYGLVQTTPPASDMAALVALWKATLATIHMYDDNAAALHEKVEQPVWGHISNAVERIVEADAYVPGTEDMPSLDELLGILERLWASRFPEPREKDEGSNLSWGNWEVRVYAAQAYVELARRFGQTHGELVGKFDVMLADPAPQVRLQAAQRLLVLWHVARDKMWDLAEQVARDEPHTEVLASFLHYVVPRVTWQDVEKCKAIIEIVRARRESVERVGQPGCDEVAEQLGSLTAQLWCWQEDTLALDWLKAWAEEPAVHREFFTSFLSMLRSAFFARYADGKERDVGLADRSQQAAMIILEACLVVAEASHAAVTGGKVRDAEREGAVAAYQASESVIGHLMNQFYFGSGAYTGNNEAPAGLKSPDAMRRFLMDYRPMLALLATSHEPSTHHHLVQLYEFLIPGHPAGVFDALHALLTGPAAREGYHHEGLAAPVIVRMITRYIADHRSIFEDDTRRAGLVEILRLFSDVGWSDALKLLYDLPDLLR
ncbi:MAG: ATP-binding protein [Bosea sp.]|nr:ATP-binding protein [Bosea sp. (in: a-proteobacteria)]